MPLNLSINDGSEFTPYIKYNSKAGRWYAKPKDGAEAEIINPRLAFDMANIKTGWIMFTEGMGPVSIWDDGTQMAAKPEGKYKRGFHVVVCGGDNLPGIGPLGLREFSSTANAVIGPILDMHKEYEDQINAHPGQVPFFECTGVTPITGMHGTNYEPGFRLIGWVDRSKVPMFDEHLKAHIQTATANGGRQVLPAPNVATPDVNAPIAQGGNPIPDFTPRDTPSVGDEINDGIPWE